MGSFSFFMRAIQSAWKNSPAGSCWMSYFPRVSIAPRLAGGAGGLLSSLRCWSAVPASVRLVARGPLRAGGPVREPRRVSARAPGRGRQPPAGTQSSAGGSGPRGRGGTQGFPAHPGSGAVTSLPRSQGHSVNTDNPGGADGPASAGVEVGAAAWGAHVGSSVVSAVLVWGPPEAGPHTAGEAVHMGVRTEAGKEGAALGTCADSPGDPGGDREGKGAGCW